jgi:hypothetical protein
MMDLLDKLLDLKGTPNEVQASQRENGLASAIIVLSVLMVESAIARVKFDEDTTTPRSSLKFMQSRFPDFSGRTILEELFVIRDAIVHNHLWQAKITWDIDMDMKLLAAEKWEGSGDSKLSAVIDTNTRKSKILGLNLFPTRIAKEDAIQVLKQSTGILQYIEENGSKLVNVSNQNVEFRGQLVEYLDLVSSL